MSLQPVNFQTGQILCPVTATLKFQTHILQRISLHSSNTFRLIIEGDAPKLTPILEWFTAFGHGKHLPFPHPLESKQSPFEQKVLDALQVIRFGDVKTYSELARQIGNPHAARAVGNACNKNPYPLVIPCHRLIRADGKVGGFAFDHGIKQKLLLFEERITREKEDR